MSGGDNPSRPRVAVVGGGWAGCAAAVTLAQRGHAVTLYEAGPVLGGRARRVPRAGLALDNGQHLLLGAYRSTLSLLDVVHGPAAEAGRLRRRPLALVPADPAAEGAVALVAPALPAPFGLLAGLLRSQGLTPGERLGVIRWFIALKRGGFRRPDGETVAQLLAKGPVRAARGLWEPLCLAALNTPVERASAQVFAGVLEAAFDAGTRDADLLLPATDLSALFPDAAARFVTAHAGHVVTATPAQVESLSPEGVRLRAGGALETYAAAVVAVAPYQLARALAPSLPDGNPGVGAALAAVGGLRYEPIVTVWLGYPVATPLSAALLRLDDRPGQWCFDRPDIVASATADAAGGPLRQVLGIVISAHGDHERLDHAALAAACEAQVRRLVPRMPAASWSQVIEEKRATYACVPGRPRPDGNLPHSRVALAGDYMDAQFPATLEAAVRSGIAAATSLDATLRAPVTP